MQIGSQRSYQSVWHTVHCSGHVFTEEKTTRTTFDYMMSHTFASSLLYMYTSEQTEKQKYVQTKRAENNIYCCCTLHKRAYTFVIVAM